MNVKFFDRVVEMSRLCIDRNTTYLFKKFVATGTKKKSSRFGNDVTVYVIFLAPLMSLSDDVQYWCVICLIFHTSFC
jgi:hypothetical protein